MFGIVLTTLVTAMHLYVFWRIRGIKAVHKRIGDKALLCIMLVLWCLFFIGREFADKIDHPVAIAIELAGMNWMGSLFVMASIFMVCDLLTGFGFIFKNLTQVVRTFALCAGLVLAVTANIQGLRTPVVTTYHIAPPALDPALDGTRIIALADSHLGRLINADWMDKVATRINARKPDIILLAGDIFEGHDEMPPELIKSFNRLVAPLGLYGVIGNHDDHKDAQGRYELERSKATLLFNESRTVAPGLVIAGIEDLTGHSRGRRSDDIITPVLQNAPEGTVIFLSHVPWTADKAAAIGADIMISGHTHNGQIWPFNYLVQQRYPHVYGRYTIGKMALLVSRGAGTWGPRARFPKPGEIVEIILHASTQNP